MARYRPIFTKIWDDPDFQECTPKEKLIFVYLCTNSLTTESGIYSISTKTISNDTGIARDEVEDILHNNRIRNVHYDTESKVVFVNNFLRYNGKGRKDLVLKSVYNDYINIKTSLWEKFQKHYSQYFERILTLCQQLSNSSTPIPVPSPNPMLKSSPALNPSPIHNDSNHTPYSANEQKNDDDADDEAPVEKMVDIFIKHWSVGKDGSYHRNPQKEQKVAQILWKLCKADRPEAPLAYFERRVEDLILDFDIKHFSGLLNFWNASAGNDWLDFARKNMT